MNAAATSALTRTTCPYCGVGCGVIVKPLEDGGVEIGGDPDHPANFGKLCSKGSALGETLSLETRLLYPVVDGGRASWDVALDRVARGLRETIEKYGPNSVAFYLSGQLLTEDYYVANKLMKGFLGSANVDTNSRLCMASSVAGHKRAFGSDTVPGSYEDLDEADLIVFVGSNAAWCHPVLYQRMLRAKQTRGTKFVNIDPRRSANSESADLQLSLRPGTDSILFAGLLWLLVDSGEIDVQYVSKFTDNFDESLKVSRQIAGSVEQVAFLTGLAVEDVAEFYHLWASNERVVTLYSQGVNQSAQGTDKVNAIINCHLATGRIGRVGMGPFSLTGQPNAMGGREVGGLANQLAAHMGFSPEEVDRVGRFWNAPRMATQEGLKAVDMFDAIDRGEIKALWVMGTNPVVSLPRADFVRTALGKLDLFVVSENVARNDTIAAGAHVVLPAAAWGEKDGTVTNSERRISRQRAFLPMPGEVWKDWEIICNVAGRLGFENAFGFSSAAEIFREHAALSSFENGGTRDFDLGGLLNLTERSYHSLEPIQWPVNDGGFSGANRMFADGRYFTASGRARFAVIAAPELGSHTDSRYPLMLNTGRVRDQWHTMTRTGLSPRLGGHRSEPFVEINTQDAVKYGVADGGLVRLESESGAVTLRAVVTDDQQDGTIFAPIHWTDEIASHARVGALVNAKTDPFSGQPELKATPAKISPVSFPRSGFVMSRTRMAFDRESFWSWSAIDGGFACRMETDRSIEVLLETLKKLVDGPVETLQYQDEYLGIDRVALLRAGRVLAIVFLGSERGPTPWAGLLPAWTSEAIGEGHRRMLLSGHLADGCAPRSATVCACFGIAGDVIENILAQPDGSVENVGRLTRAGTNCGSCVPDMRKIMQRLTANAPVELTVA